MTRSVLMHSTQMQLHVQADQRECKNYKEIQLPLVNRRPPDSWVHFPANLRSVRARDSALPRSVLRKSLSIFEGTQLADPLRAECQVR